MTRPLRLGVMCAVFQDDQLLLSQRGDLRVWALPGGRLDSGERFVEAAAREVREETGLEAQVEGPIGLYYLAGWRRLNVLFAARAKGGTLRAVTAETRDNRFFALNDLPAMPLRMIAEDAVRFGRDATGYRAAARIVQTAPAELRRLRLRLALRWLGNALRGRREPHFARFTVQAAAVIGQEGGQRILTLRREKADGMIETHALPRVICHGDQAPWQTLAAFLEARCGVRAELQFVGLWQDAAHDRVEIIFAAVVPPQELIRTGTWSLPRNSVLIDRDRRFVQRVLADLAADIPLGRRVWIEDAREAEALPPVVHRI